MPTDPVEKVLNRHLSRVAAIDAINHYVPLLEELVNYGTTVYARCRPTVPAENLTPSDAPLQLYLHMLEMLDGVAELLNHSCVTPAIPIARAIFEAKLGLEYMLAGDFDRRARSWLVAYTTEQLEAADLITSEGDAGKAFLEAKADDPNAAKLDFSYLAKAVEVQRPKLEDYLKSPEFHPIIEERSAKRNRRVPWYGLFGGPANVRQLAKVLRQQGVYLILYRLWSSVSHGSNTRRFHYRRISQDPTTRLIRDSGELPTVAQTTAGFVIHATALVLAKYRPSDQPIEWYLDEVRSRFVGPAGA